MVHFHMKIEKYRIFSVHSLMKQIKIHINRCVAVCLIFTLFPTIIFAETSETPINNISTPADVQTFVGLRKTRTAKILDNFKNEEREILFENVPFTEDDEKGILHIETRIKGLSKYLTRIESAKQQYKERKIMISKKKNTLKRAIENLDEDIVTQEKEISLLSDDINQKNRDIRSFGDKILELEKKIEENKSSILKYLLYIYSRGDLVYDDTHNVDVLRSIILNDGNMTDIFNDVHYKSLLEVAGQNYIEQHRSLIREYYATKERIKDEKNTQGRMRRNLVAKKRDLESIKQYKQQLLEITK